MHHGMPDRSKMHNSSPLLPCYPREYLDPHPSILVDLAFKLHTYSVRIRTRIAFVQSAWNIQLDPLSIPNPSTPTQQQVLQPPLNSTTETQLLVARCHLPAVRMKWGLNIWEATKVEATLSLWIWIFLRFWGFTLTFPMSKKGLEFRLVPSFLLGIMDKRIPQSITEPRWERKMDPVEWSLHQTSWHPADVSHWKIREAVGEILPSLSRNYHPPGFSLKMFKDTRLCFRFHRFLYSICHTLCFGTLYEQEIQGKAFYELTNLSCCLPCPCITIDVMGLLVLLVQNISLSDRAETQKILAVTLQSQTLQLP